MKRRLFVRVIRSCQTLLLLTGLLVATGCATFRIHEAKPGEAPKGVRIYPPKIYLLVDTCAGKSRLLYAPDYERAYDVEPLTIFARQDFRIELDDGQLKKLTSDQDTTAVLTFFEGAASVGAKAAGSGVSSTSVEGTFGLADGVWTIDASGPFRPLRLTQDRKCP